MISRVPYSKDATANNENNIEVKLWSVQSWI